MGGPPQHSTWDPKPDAIPEVRGEFGPIDTNVPGIRVASLLPRTAKLMEKVCVLRAVSTGDNAHSSSGYFMLTGVPHQPMNAENANPGAPNDWPNIAAIVRRMRRRSRRAAGGRAAADAHLQHRSVGLAGPGRGLPRPGLGPVAVPLRARLGELPHPRVHARRRCRRRRLGERRDLLQQLDRKLAAEGATIRGAFSPRQAQAFDLLTSPRARAAFDLAKEPARVRDRYGRHHFGQSCLLARRLVEAGVSLVHVNWFRGPDEPDDAPCWDSHVDEGKRLKTVLAPTADQAFAALVDDLAARGLLDETLVVCMAEFGRTPKFNGRAGRDHWGPVFSVALAGGGIRGGMVYGASDAQGAYPKDGRVLPQDLHATIYHLLGIPKRRRNPRQPRPPAAGDARGSGAGDPVVG